MNNLMVMRENHIVQDICQVTGCTVGMVVTVIKYSVLILYEIAKRELPALADWSLDLMASAMVAMMEAAHFVACAMVGLGYLAWGIVWLSCKVAGVAVRKGMQTKAVEAAGEFLDETARAVMEIMAFTTASTAREAARVRSGMAASWQFRKEIMQEMH